MKDFYKILRGEVGLGQEIPLWGGIFLYRALLCLLLPESESGFGASSYWGQNISFSFHQAHDCSARPFM